jgi:hypothetical protein
MDESGLREFLRGATLEKYLNPFGESRETALKRRLRWARVNQYDFANKTEAKYLLANREALLDRVRQMDRDHPLMERVAKKAISAPEVLRSFMQPRSAIPQTPQSTDPRPVVVASIQPGKDLIQTPAPAERRLRPQLKKKKNKIPRPIKACENCSNCGADIRTKVAYLTPAMDDWLCRECAKFSVG